VVYEAKLSATLSEFARTLGTDFPIQGILDRLVRRIVEMLPVSAAGVTLISPGMAPQFIAASNDAALEFERLQTDIAQGPCLLAYQAGAPVVVPDLLADGRFPLFAPPALAAGLAAVFAFPMRHDTARIGALDLYRDTPGPLGPRDLTAAQTLADVAAGYLANAQTREEAREISDRFRRGSLYDSLTGLPNRVLLQQRLAHAARRAQRLHAPAGVLFIDLDGFKAINDRYGSLVGDHLLCAVAERLSSCIRPGDTMARLQGDEFVFLCEDLRDATDVEAIASRVTEAFSTPFILAGRATLELTITASVGVAYAGPGDEVSDRLLANADIAMHEAKRRGGTAHRVLDLREIRVSRDRATFRRELRKAFAQDKLHVAYQPIVRTGDGLVTAAEALLRWTDFDRGPIPTRTMVEVAEHNGLITGIGAWVLERACNDRGMWVRQNPGVPLDVSVNVSAHQLMDLGFGQTVAAILEKSAMDPTALVLEVTASALMDDAERAMIVLAELALLGIRLTLDNFGTGYSSLTHLRQFPVDTVKIDPELVADIDREPNGAAVIEAITKLAQVLDLRVIAHGVETRAQHEAVLAAGCDNAQGYGYAQPMPSRDIGAELATRHGRFLLPPAEIPQRKVPDQ
jgi:diguanylate cyclase (GGDEF)-like protein